MTALAVRDRDELLAGASETGLVLADGLGETEWREIGEKIGRAARASAWWVGDWINYGEIRWGEKYDEAERITGLSYRHLTRCATVARQFDLGHRCPNLTWTHHNVAKPLPDAAEWLARAEAEEWSVRELTEHSRPARLTVPFKIETERQRQVAEAAKLRVEKAVGACSGLARGLDGIKVERAVAVSRPDEISGWDDSFRDAIATLKKLRSRLKEASP